MTARPTIRSVMRIRAVLIAGRPARERVSGRRLWMLAVRTQANDDDGGPTVREVK